MPRRSGRKKCLSPIGGLAGRGMKFHQGLPVVEVHLNPPAWHEVSQYDLTIKGKEWEILWADRKCGPGLSCRSRMIPASATDRAA